MPDEINEKLTELYNALSEFQGISDRTRAIEDLAKKFSEVGEAQTGEIEKRLTDLCGEVLASIKKAKDVPSQIKAAADSLDRVKGKTTDKLEEAAGDIEKAVDGSMDKFGSAVSGFKRDVGSLMSQLDGKLKEVKKTVPGGGLDDVTERLAEIDKKLDVVVESQVALSEVCAKLSSEIVVLKEMVGKIPLKRSIF